MDNEFFEFSDAWVMTSLFMYDSKFQELILTHVIANGDVLNHAIFSLDELNKGFNKLIAANLIKFENDSIRLTESGLEIKAKVSREKGGLFERINNTLKRLQKLNIYTSNIREQAFFDEKDLENAYNLYKKSSQQQ